MDSFLAASRPVTATRAPKSRNPSAMARPNPPLPPVMSAARPSSENNGLSMSIPLCPTADEDGSRSLEQPGLMADGDHREECSASVDLQEPPSKLRALATLIELGVSIDHSHRVALLARSHHQAISLRSRCRISSLSPCAATYVLFQPSRKNSPRNASSSCGSHQESSKRSPRRSARRRRYSSMVASFDEGSRITPILTYSPRSAAGGPRETNAQSSRMTRGSGLAMIPILPWWQSPCRRVRG